jgi:hypothetical protein
LLSSFGAMLRISLRRSRADWPIVVSAALICLLAATLLAAGTIYGSAVATAGLHRTLADATFEDRDIAVSALVPPAAADAVDATVTEAIDALGPRAGELRRFGESGTFALPDQPADAVRELAVLGSAEGLAEHATLLDGAWPDALDPAGDVIGVVVADVVAERLGLHVGDRLTLESRVQPGATITISIGGIMRIDDPSAAYWWGDPQVADGLVVSDRFHTHGPLFTTPAGLAAASGTRVMHLAWRAFPDVAAIGLADIGSLRAGAVGLKARIAAGTTATVDVSTGLPDLLASTERSLLVSRTGVLMLSIQLVILAVYAVLLSASLLVEHRRMDTAMLRSRGAGTARIVLLATIEGLVLLIPAVLIAPWLAAVLLRAFDLTGPLADIGLTIEPVVAVDAYLAAAAAGLLCLLALILPAFRSARTYASVHGTPARSETRGIAQRLGLDIALLAVAAIGLWQLRHYGAPLTRSVQGAIGLDPLLVAVPALGLLAGAILALRIVPLLAAIMERGLTRRRSLVPSLGARQLARRPLRYTRAALLLMLAMAIGVFAVSYTRTWVSSQRDQAAFQVGAAMRVLPGTSRSALPKWALDRAYAAIPGVTAQLPLERETISTTRGSRSSQLVGLDAASAPTVVMLRPDLADAGLADLMAPLVADRPSLEAIRLPGEPTQVRVTVGIDIRVLERRTYDDETGGETVVPGSHEDLRTWQGLRVSLVVRDERGLLHRFDGGPTSVEVGTHDVTVALGSAAGAARGSLSYPLDLLGIELSIGLPGGYVAPDATVTVGALATASADGEWRPASLELADGWRSDVGFVGEALDMLATGLRGPTLAAVTGGDALRELSEQPRDRPASIISFRPAALDAVAARGTRIVASDRLLAVAGIERGDTLGLIIGGERHDVVVSGTIRAFPGNRPTDPIAVMDLATLSLLRYAGDATVAAPDEWWLAVADGTAGSVSATLGAPPFGSLSVISEDDRSRSLTTDPVALGIIGALAIGFVAAALFAIVGFIVSAAVSARERVTEFALLRALGLSSGQLSLWLSLENAVLASVSLLAGTVLGLLIVWVVLPFITVTQGAATPYPPVLIEVPWPVITVLLAAGALALGATVLGLAWLLPRIGLASVMRIGED